MKSDIKSVIFWTITLGSIFLFFYWLNYDKVKASNERAAPREKLIASAEKKEPPSPEKKLNSSQAKKSPEIKRDEGRPNKPIDCDKIEAQRIFDTSVRNFGVRVDDQAALHLDIDYAWNQMTINDKNTFLRIITSCDICIKKKIRNVIIYSWDEKVAEYSPYTGYKVLK